MATDLILRNVTVDPNRIHFSGKGTPVNSEGSRNFTINFDLDKEEELVDNLIEQGWPIRKSELQNGMRIGRLKVLINFNFGRPPKFEMLLKKPAFDKMGNQIYNDDNHEQPLYHVKKVILDEETSKEIDNFDITDVKVLINQGFYQKRDGSGEKGVCCYLKEMQFTKMPGAFEYDIDAMDVSEIRPDLVGDIECPFEV